MASNRGLKAVRDLLVLSHFDDLLDDAEFLMLYDANSSKDIYPCWKFNKFNLAAWNDTECQTELRFAKKYFHEILEILHLPEKIICSQGTVSFGYGGSLHFPEEAFISL